MPSPVQSPQLDKRDIPLMTRLHARIKDLEKDKARLMMDLDRREFRSDLFEGSAEHSEMEIYDALRVNICFKTFGRDIVYVMPLYCLADNHFYPTPWHCSQVTTEINANLNVTMYIHGPKKETPT
jgi:hypothetical protein